MSTTSSVSHTNNERISDEWKRRMALLKLAFTKSIFSRDDDLVHPLDGSESIYDEELDLIQAFNRDRYWLRDTLDIHIEPVGGPGSRNQYHLKQIGPRFAQIFLPVGLTTLLALAQLPQVSPNFPPGLLNELMDDVRRRLGSENGGKLDEALAGAEYLATWRDPGQLDRSIVSQLRLAIQDRRIVVFDYSPSRVDDDESRRHWVEPYRLEAREGHLYLDGYAQQVDGPYGLQKGGHYDYRLSGIVPDSLHLLDDHYLAERPRPRHLVHYILSAKLAKRGGSVSFDEVERIDRLDHRLEIRAYTVRPFDAMRKLLSYGAECEVLGGDIVRDQYRTELNRMLKAYAESGK